MNSLSLLFVVSIYSCVKLYINPCLLDVTHLVLVSALPHCLVFAPLCSDTQPPLVLAVATQGRRAMTLALSLSLNLNL